MSPVGTQLLILYCLLPKQLITLLRSLHSRDGGREQWLSDELRGWRVLPLRQHSLPASPCTLLTVNIGVCQLVARHLNRLCQLEKSHLLVGRRHAIVPETTAEGHMPFTGKICRGRNMGGGREKGGYPRGQSVSDGRPFLMKFTGKAGG